MAHPAIDRYATPVPHISYANRRLRVVNDGLTFYAISLGRYANEVAGKASP